MQVVVLELIPSPDQLPAGGAVSNDDFLTFICDQLRGLGDVRPRAMFGGVGLYLGDRFFGIVARGRLYFKTDQRSRRRYEAAGMGPFRPNRRQTLKRYYEVPVDVIEDDTRLASWARDAVSCDPTPSP